MGVSEKHASRFRKISLITVAAVYLLFVVGSIVRTTGAGMGCPDWPRCFGQWVPPTDISELPADYKTQFAVQGREIADFDAFKTWTEYLNRLTGVLIGLLIFATLLFSLAFRRSDRLIPIFAFLAFVSVGIEGWLGAKVVYSNLLPGMISLHMAFALLIVALLLFAVYRSFGPLLSQEKTQNKKLIVSVLYLCFGLTLVQIVLGTQVREGIDRVAELLNYAQREIWPDGVGLPFIIHRSFSWLLFISHAYFIYILLKNTNSALYRKFAGGIGFLVFAEILTGIFLTYLGMPKWAQPLHLVIASLIFGAQFVLILLLNRETAGRS